LEQVITSLKTTDATLFLDFYLKLMKRTSVSWNDVKVASHAVFQNFGIGDDLVTSMTLPTLRGMTHLYKYTNKFI